MGGGAAVALAIKVTADAKQAQSELGNATRTTSKLGRAGQVAGRLLAAGLLVAAGAAVKFTQAAADDAQAQTKLAATAKQVAGATTGQVKAMEDWISAQGKALGVTDDELRPALEKLITATGSVGKAQKLASLAMDVSARSGKSLDSVTQALVRAQNGSVSGLSRLGVATKDAQGKTKTFAQVQKDLAKLYTGSAAAAADTAAGKQKILSVQMGELQEQIGTGLLPVMSKLVTVGLKVVDWISKNQKAAAAIIITIGSLLAVIKAVSLATQAYTAIQTLLNVVMAANPVVLIVLALVALAAALVIAYKKSETFRNIVNAAFAGISKVVGATVDFIRDHWRTIIAIIGGPVGIAVALVSKHWDKVKAGALAVIDWVRAKWPVIKGIVTTPFETAKTVISKVWDAITTGFRTAKETLSKIAGAIETALTTPFNKIRDVVQFVIDKVQALIDKIKSIPGIPGSGGSGTAQKPPQPGANTTSRTSVGTTTTSAPVTYLTVNLNGPVYDIAAVTDQLVTEFARRGVRLGTVVAA